MRSHQHSRSDLNEPREKRASASMWDPSSWGATSDAQSPMKGSESPLTVVAAEDLPGSPEAHRSPVREGKWDRSQRGARSPERGMQDPDAPMLLGRSVKNVDLGYEIFLRPDKSH